MPLSISDIQKPTEANCVVATAENIKARNPDVQVMIDTSLCVERRGKTPRDIATGNVILSRLSRALLTQP